MGLNNHLKPGLIDLPMCLKMAVFKDGYTRCQSDYTLFVKHSEDGRIAAIIVYVHDIVLTGNHTEEMACVKLILSKVFEMKDFGHLKYFLGMEIAT